MKPSPARPLGSDAHRDSLGTRWDSHTHPLALPDMSSTRSRGSSTQQASGDAGAGHPRVEAVNCRSAARDAVRLGPGVTLSVVHTNRAERQRLEWAADDGRVADGDNLQVLGADVRARSTEDVGRGD